MLVKHMGTTPPKKKIYKVTDHISFRQFLIGHFLTEAAELGHSLRSTHINAIWEPFLLQ
jgi:hypothetical protein